MKNSLRKLVLYTILESLVLIFMLSSCGNPSQLDLNVNQKTTSAEMENKTYFLKSNLLPDADQAMENAGILDNKNKYALELDYQVSNHVVYRLSSVYELVDGTNYIIGSCIQVLQEPYLEWENFFYTTESWVDGKNYMPSSFAYMDNQTIYVIVNMLNSSQKCLVRIIEEGKQDFVKELPATYRNSKWYRDEDNFYVVENYSNMITVLNQNFEEKEEIQFPGRIMGNGITQDGEYYWYGYDKDDLIIWQDIRGSIYTKLTIADGFSINSDIRIELSKTNEIFYATFKDVYCGKEELQKMFSFTDKDFAFDALDGMCVGADGKLIIFASYGTERYKVIVEENGEITEKQEIKLALTDASEAIKNVVARYNHGNEKYRVKIISPQPEEDENDYCQNIQLQISAGKGPDLVEDTIIKSEEAIKKGYFTTLDDVIPDMSDYFESVFTGGTIDGVLYGMPYKYMLITLIVSEELVGERTTWSIDEMMKLVGEGDHKPVLFCINVGGPVGIIQNCGISDLNNKDYLDWDNYQSYLNQQPFIDLLEFAKKYGDESPFTWDQVGEQLELGNIAGINFCFDDLQDLKVAQCVFNNKTSYIGYPRSNGRGIYFHQNYLYLNQASDCQEGAKDFLRYFVSAEGQRVYLNCKGELSRLSIRKDIMEEEIRASKNWHIVGDGPFGIYCVIDEIEEELKEKFLELIHIAQPYPSSKVDRINEIIQEETQAYFYGTATKEDTASKIHNRVQLYLDEIKSS